MRRLIVGLAAALMIVAAGQAKGAIYINDFEGSVGTEWSNTSTSTTPVGSRKFLGEFGSETATLTLAGLEAHSSVTVDFQLFLNKSWDGNDLTWGPDVWRLAVTGGPVLLETTFSNTGSDGHNQAYPGDVGSTHPARTGAAESDSLGYSFYGDTVYDLSFTFLHSASTLGLDFSARGLQGLGDESWGLDNVVVSTNAIPEPASMAVWGLLSMVTFGGCYWRKRKQ